MSHSVARLSALVLSTSLLAASIGNATAAGLAGLSDAEQPTDASYVAERVPTLAPMSHVVLCMEQPGECSRAPRADAVVALSGDRRAELDKVNRAVNRTIRPRTDRTDRWVLAPREGDCDDYAVTKRHRLVAMGWPASALRLAVVRTPNGEGHAVLVVKTTEGDLVLDNRTSRIKLWSETGLRWVKIQSSRDPRRWFAL
jgi:predicted transglutaminase-like cysteine proteinase